MVSRTRPHGRAWLTNHQEEHLKLAGTAIDEIESARAEFVDAVDSISSDSTLDDALNQVAAAGVAYAEAIANTVQAVGECS